MLWLNLTLFTVSAIALLFSSNWLVKSLSKIAGFLRMQEFTAGFAIMAVATSLPELFVGISAALHKNTALSLGNVIGSNIVDLTLIAGIGILLTRGYTIKTTETRKDALFMVGFAFLPLLLMLLGKQISRVDGAILLLAFVAYMVRIIKKRKDFPKKIHETISRGGIVFNVFLFIFSLVFLLFAADKMVEYGTALSLDLLLPPILIGLFLIALATSLPELAFETSALLKGRSEMALGDLIGSVVTNSSLVLGVTAVIHPISADFFLTITSGFFMLLVSFLFATFVATKRLTWKEGVSLILLYVFFVILEFFIK
ncbi:sodium:calcium antiporter [Candidatus Woesearchaeota archaeon]|nr:sodium:calcium antiporter [Candidatus Woesearchaeota archaeon]